MVTTVQDSVEFKLGYYAYLIGLKRNDNMYHWPEPAQRWLSGWDEAWLDDQ